MDRAASASLELDGNGCAPIMFGIGKRMIHFCVTNTGGHERLFHPPKVKRNDLDRGLAVRKQQNCASVTSGWK